MKKTFTLFAFASICVALTSCGTKEEEKNIEAPAGMVALDLSRLVIGFEIREDYCDIAANRIETFLSDKKGRVEQLSLL